VRRPRLCDLSASCSSCPVRVARRAPGGLPRLSPALTPCRLAPKVARPQKNRSRHGVGPAAGHVGFDTNGKSNGYLCDLWEKRPAIAGGNVYRVPRCLTPCQPVSPAGPQPAAPVSRLVTYLVTCPVTSRALSLAGKGPDLRKLVAGGGFEPPTSGL
jgi:hypothetical protein